MSGACVAEVLTQRMGSRNTFSSVYFGRRGRTDDTVSGVSGVFFP